MVGNAFSAVIKLDYVFDLPKTRLFIPGKDKLAKYMVCVTTIFSEIRTCPSLGVINSHIVK
jgi:hypothetical protein